MNDGPPLPSYERRSDGDRCFDVLKTIWRSFPELTTVVSKEFEFAFLKGQGEYH